MIEPVALPDFFTVIWASALTVMAAAAYASFYALAKLAGSARLKLCAYAAFAVMVVAVWVLSVAARFSGFWLILSALLVVGYFFAPRGIWRLCVYTHAEAHKLERINHE